MTYIHPVLKAGVGKVDITIKEGELSYGRYPPKAMVHIPPIYREQRVTIDDPLYVRALVLDNGVEKIVLVTMDVTAICARSISQHILFDSADDFLLRLRSRIERDLCIPGDRVSVSASHTHPPGLLLCDDDEQIERTLAAIRQAMDNLTPVVIGIGAGYEDSLTVNRNVILKDGTDWTWRPEAPGQETESVHPIDPEIGLVRIDRLDGRPLALLYDFASHLMGSKGAITADFPGATSKWLEERIGDDFTAIFLQGANGDIMDKSWYDFDNPRTVQDFRCRLGSSVLAAYRKIRPGSATLGVATRQVEFPLRKDIPEAVAAIKREQAELVASTRYTDLSFKTFLPLYLKFAMDPDFPNHLPLRYMADDARGDKTLRIQDEQNRAAVQKYLQSLGAMEKMSVNELKIATLEKHGELIEWLGGEKVAAEIKAIRIGECVFIAAPMEVLCEVGFNVKKLSPFKHTYIVSNANGYLHYSPPAAYYGRGGYEATECLLDPGWEPVFMKTVQDLLNELAVF